MRDLLDELLCMAFLMAAACLLAVAGGAALVLIAIYCPHWI